ncbi:MAG: hypothetical protein LQ349_003599 [Xanthoria aureola]|nr:MAG: hypothetical protein LQ349_003599 [Xanthoria aureola]
MATPVSETARQKPSFASIAAMAPPGRKKPDTAALKNGHQKATNPSLPAKSTVGMTSPPHLIDAGLQDSLAEMSINPEKVASRTDGTPEIASSVRLGLRFEDEQTHLSISSTKPASLDGKSTASGTTFAMDEKESLRPDDSASVKAADEEDSYSGPGSGAPSSHLGSETGGRAFRDQFYEISERINRVPERTATTTTSHQAISDIEEEAVQGAVPSLQQSLPQAVAPAGPGLLPVSGPVFQMSYRDPDEKLLEALESPKDRLFVLRLEHDVINFIQNSTDQTLDLRTPNSFCRLLAHKLADYYAMTHHADGVQNVVKLYRTPYCRIRTPLTAYSQANANADVSASSQPAVKIMRRAGLIKNGVRADSGPNTTDSSIAPSKAGSENGEESGRGTGLVSPTESDLSKDRATMTREEREAKYKEARDRIFNDNADSGAINEVAQGISRTSSANGKRKSRKQRNNNDDGFEARSNFTAYYPALPYSGPPFDQTPTTSAYFNTCMPQPYPSLGEPSPANPAMYSSNYESGYNSMPSTPGYPVPMQQYPMANVPTMNGFGAMQPFPGFMQPVSQQYYQQPRSPPTIGQHSPAPSSPALINHTQLSRPQSQTAEQQWGQMAYHHPYQQPSSQQHFPPSQHHLPDPTPSVQAVPYQYGQLPYQPHLAGSRSAHPLPGSYNRQQAFNPQTRSFVPSASSQPSSNGTALQDLTPNNRFTSAPSCISGPSYMGLPHPTGNLPGPLQFGSFGPIPETKPQQSRKSQSNSDENQPPAKSSLAKWGVPANLPPKPPPLDPPSMPEGRLSLPQNVPSQNNVSVMSNGQSMPTFQNGVYTLPGHHHQ